MIAFSFGVYSMAPCGLKQGVALVLIAVREQTTLHRIAFAFVRACPVDWRGALNKAHV